MRSIDEIIAESQTATATALREAFEAGRAHTASELKTRMAAFFDGLVSDAGAHLSPPAAPAEGDHHSDDHHEGHHG